LSTKRFAGLAAAALLGLVMVGCAAAPSSDQTDPETLVAAIDTYLTDHPERLCTAPLFLPYDERVEDAAKAVASGRGDERRWLDGLADAGLLIKARTTARGTGSSGPTPVDEYALSAAGKREIADLRRVEMGGPARFCVADTRVGQIVDVTPTAGRHGERGAAVRYRQTLGTQERWTTSARARAGMPWLSAWTRDQLAEKRVTLRQTAGGWIVL
jgi:DNA-binding PadR family transcriptional regulator